MSTQRRAPSWTCSGTYFESCNCEAACPCIFLSPPTQGDCTALVGWHIEEGQDGGVGLDELNVAMAVHAPGKMHETKWDAALYIDERANDAQKGALLRIFSGQAGGHPAVLASFIGKVLGVRSVPIHFDGGTNERSLEIPEIASLEMEAIEGAGGAPVEVSSHPLAIAPGFPVQVARSKHLTYEDFGKSWSLTGRNGLFSPFEYRG